MSSNGRRNSTHHRNPRSIPVWHKKDRVKSRQFHNLLDNYLGVAEYDIDLVKSVRFLASLTVITCFEIRGDEMAIPAQMAIPAAGKLPKSTPVSSLGFTAAQLAKMTPGARALTKADLIALQKWSAAGGKGAAPAHLTVADISSLVKASAATPQAQLALAKKSGGGTTYCCCCSPCCTCCAAAEILPVRSL